MEETIRQWKEKLAGDPEEARRHIKDMPPEVAEALAKDPEMSYIISALRAERRETSSPKIPRYTPPGEQGGDTEGREHKVYDLDAMEPGGGAAAPGEPETGDGYKMSAAATKARQDREEREAQDEQAKKLGLLSRIQKMDAGTRMKLARNGDGQCRSILIKDSNKQISAAVLANPKMTIQEIEKIAASRNVSDEILRLVADNKDWVKSYAVILNLVNNPKTPVGISLTYLPRLLTRDLRYLAKSKGIPEVIRTTAKRHADKRQV